MWLNETLLSHLMKFKYIQDIVICEQTMAMNRPDKNSRSSADLTVSSIFYLPCKYMYLLVFLAIFLLKIGYNI